MVSRREVIKLITALPPALYLQSILGCSNEQMKDFPPETKTTIHKATGPDTATITRRMLDGLGGIDTLIDKNDIVILKPNSQWWHQGMTHTDVMAEFIRQVLAIPGFKGEIIIADNHQSKEPNSRGWTTSNRNGHYNYNELVDHFNDSGYPNVTKYHWHPAGPNPTPLQLDGAGDSVVEHPSQGDGYIWPKDFYYECPYGNRCILAYPIFTSSYSGVTIDLKDGAFKNGSYTGQPLKFINFSALNHHSGYAGVTASVKNFMGVVDMSCGYHGPEPAGYFNTHHIGASGLFRFMMRNRHTLRKLPFFYELCLHPSVFRFRYTGGVLGQFMARIRRADLNIITAINIGWGSRTDTDMARRADTVLASTDPVALDYWAAANLLLPATIESGADDWYRKANDPTIPDGNLRRFLDECRPVPVGIHRGTG
ncbi:MAG: DUF362 domain-containing protein, partial [candidate division Zixibacteria bacterium]|nr:DUF362 domain-containing protein [candidate division Zixibacteria bacterium]